MSAALDLPADGREQLRRLVEALDPSTSDLLHLPGVVPCAACGRPCGHAKRVADRPAGVLRLCGRGRCGACYAAGRPALVEPVRLAPGPAPILRTDLVDEQRGERPGADGPAPDSLAWQRDAACRDVKDRAPFELGEHAMDGPTPVAAIVAARRWCARCPVIAECDDFARVNREMGLWGGRWRPATGKPREIRTLSGITA